MNRPELVDARGSTFEEAIAEVDEVERRLAAALERTPLPADRAVDRFLVDAYRRAWSW